MEAQHYVSETVMIKCRVKTCQVSLMRKNYKDHLIKRHPRENPQDLSPFGQSKISNFFSQAHVSALPSRQAENLEETGQEGEGQAERQDGDIGLQVDAHEHLAPVDQSVGEKSAESNKYGGLGKRRHSSADSGIIGDGDSAEPSEKSDKCFDSEQHAKLDQILAEIEQLKSKMDSRQVAGDVVSTVRDQRIDSSMESVLLSLHVARSVEDFENIGFKYDGKSNIVCSVCEPVEAGKAGQAPGVFFYDRVHGLEFEDDEFLPQEFCNLKKSMKRHIRTSKTHSDAVKMEVEKEEDARKLLSKNQRAGMNLGNICMKNYKLGRPYTDYEADVLLLEKSGAIVGELNHSRKFPAAFRSCVKKAVHNRVCKFFSTPLDCTGHLPPLAVSADKATFKHRSRQFLSVVTVIPGGDNLLEVISCGQPVVTAGSSGVELTKNIKSGLDEYNVLGCQIESGVFDGVYFHCSIEEHFDEIYKIEPGSVLYSWDGLHKSGLVDTHLAKKKEFIWLKTITDICVSIFKLFNWGANYEKMVEASALWKLKMVNLVTFSDTRFAKSRRRVYQNIHQQFGPIMTCLEDHIKAADMNRLNLEAADSKVRERGAASKELKGQILNVKFLLSLSGLADMYDQYGAVVNVAQMVRLLPHERLDLFNQAVSVLANMAACLEDHSKCAQFCEADSKVKCLWPLNHKDKMTLVEKKQIMGLDIANQHGIRAAGLSVRTRQAREEELVAADVNATEKSDKELSGLVKELYRGLSTEVYDPKSCKIIEHTRYILDLPALACRLKEPGASYIILSATDFPKFISSVENIPVRSLKIIPKDVLAQQHKEFLKRLNRITKDVAVKDLEDMDPKEIIKKFFNPADRLFEGIEMVIQAMATSAVKHSCESVLESLVSKFENHFDLCRNMGEDSAADEFEIAVNGPSLAHSDSVVKEAMQLYWKGNPWHFFKTSVVEKLGEGGDKSCVLKRLYNTKNHLPIMD